MGNNHSSLRNNDDKVKRQNRGDARDSAPKGAAKSSVATTGNYGMFVLVDKPSDQAKGVDVVAIHGLGGHYLNTWTAIDAKGNEVVWLRDFLPHQLPDARIMSYGYNSSIQFSKSVTGISDFAGQLLEDLRTWRNTQAEKDRPIIFICHSLGGIIVKQALIQAHELKRFTSLLANIRGIAFFGTPHQGSDIASWGTMFANILNFGSFGISTNTKIVKELKSNSEVLRKISTSFVERGNKTEVRIISFFETDNMEHLNCKVVNQHSGTLGWVNETRISGNGNHRTICKFPAETDQRYRTVWFNLRELTEALFNNRTLSEAESACLSRLFTSDYEGHRKRVDRHTDGTCTWILKHEKYQEWLKHRSDILWISANAGCGKSVLTSFLIDALTDEVFCATVCYFFFKDDNDQQRNSISAISAILHQIYKAQPALIKHALDWYKVKSAVTPANFSVLWKIFVDTVEDDSAGNIVCFLDGLDECESTSCVDLTAALVSYFARKCQNRSRSSSLKVLVTSRPENAIKRAFQSLPNIRLWGENETDSISKDIVLVVQANIDQLEESGLHPGLLSNLQKQLLEKADRTFIWVTLIIQLLKDASEAGASQNQLDAIIQSRDIDEVYNHLLRRSPKPVKAKAMLQITLAAPHALTLDELCVATALNWRHKTCGDLEKDLITPFDNHIRTLCGHFLRIIQNRVYFVHQTAREFLIKPDDAEAFKPGNSRSGPYAAVAFFPGSNALRSEKSISFESFMSRRKTVEPRFTAKLLEKVMEHFGEIGSEEGLRKLVDRMSAEVVQMVVSEDTKKSEREIRYHRQIEAEKDASNKEAGKGEWFKSQELDQAGSAKEEVLQRLGMEVLMDDSGLSIESPSRSNKKTPYTQQPQNSFVRPQQEAEKGLNIQEIMKKHANALELFKISAIKATQQVKEDLIKFKREEREAYHAAVNRDVKILPKSLRSTEVASFEKSISMSEAHYYILKACIHLICLVSCPTDDKSSLPKHPFSLYAAATWPVHFTRSGGKQTDHTKRLCRMLCSPSTASFKFWTRHNTQYNLKFPQGRLAIDGQSIDHENEVLRTFLGFVLKKRIVLAPQPSWISGAHFIAVDVIIEEKHSDDEDEAMISDETTEIKASEIDTEMEYDQEGSQQSYRFRNYRKVEEELATQSNYSVAFKPESFIESFLNYHPKKVAKSE